jgi:hypothetical protein
MSERELGGRERSVAAGCSGGLGLQYWHYALPIPQRERLEADT